MKRNVMIARALCSVSKTLADELAPKCLAEGAPDEMKMRLREMMAHSPSNGIVGALEAIRDRPDSTPLLQTLASVPNLLLIGEYDARTRRASMQAMAERIPGASFDIIPGARFHRDIATPAVIVANDQFIDLKITYSYLSNSETADRQSADRIGSDGEGSGSHRACCAREAANSTHRMSHCEASRALGNTTSIRRSALTQVFV
jgi:hypothetical protein